MGDSCNYSTNTRTFGAWPLHLHIHPPLGAVLTLSASVFLKARRLLLNRSASQPNIGNPNGSTSRNDNCKGNCKGNCSTVVVLPDNMSHIIELMQLPPGIRSMYMIPLLWCYMAEKLVPGQSLKKACSKGRVFFKCLSYGATDLEAQELMEKLPGAPCLADYEAWTTQLDAIQDHESWKESDETVEPEFDPELIRECIRAMYDALHSDNHEQMRQALQQSISRKLGGMDLPRLYKHCWFGTKHLIDDYVNAVRGTIEAYVAFLERPETPVEEVQRGKAFLEHAFRSYGQTALCLSGGALLGIKHLGVAKCLWESFLLPRVVCGTSAGAIVASVVAATADEDMRAMLEHLQRSRLAVFYSHSQSGLLGWSWVWSRLQVMWNKSAFYDPAFLDKVIYDLIQDITFQEAYNKTRRILNIAVSRIENTEPTVLNYITAPDVVIRTAVVASCAVPWIFPAARVLEKNPTTKELGPWKGNASQMYVDGSLDHDIPARVLGRAWNAKYFIVSQVNPHVRFFLSPEEEFLGVPITTPYHYAGLIQSAKVLILQVLNALIDGVNHVPVISGLSLWRYGSLLAQQYSGDVNIYPAIGLLDWGRILVNPTPEYMVRSVVLGERATWPKMPRIKNCLAIEVALRKAISDLNERLSFSPPVVADIKERRRRAREARPRSEARQPEFLKRRSLSTSGAAGFSTRAHSRRGSNASSIARPGGHVRSHSDHSGAVGLEDKRAKSESNLAIVMTRLSDAQQQQQQQQQQRQQQQEQQEEEEEPPSVVRSLPPRPPSPHVGGAAEERLLYMTRITDREKGGQD